MELRHALAAAVLVTACHRHKPVVIGSAPSTEGEIMLFRDGVIVRDVITIDASGPGETVAHAKLPVSVDIDEIIVVPHEGKVVIGRVSATPSPVDDDTIVRAPTSVDIVVTAPARGHYAIELSYPTTAITWDAAYTMTTDTARHHAQLRGAIAVRNSTGVDLPLSHVIVVDTLLENWRIARQAKLMATLYGKTPPAKVAIPRELGRAALPRGETRIEMLAGEALRTMKSVLVYDPIGSKLDHNDQRPLVDLDLGARATTRVTESFEITRPKGTSDLPAGPVRLLSRHADGSLIVLGESVFDAASKDAPVDTIAVGTAEGITAKRTRLELSDDEDNRRLVEEFAIELTNTRAAPVEVVVREHAYRGQAWSLGYSSSVASQAGTRAFAMTVRVPARGTAKSMHTIVYTWPP